MKKFLAVAATAALTAFASPALAQDKTEVTISQAFQSLLYLPRHPENP